MRQHALDQSAQDKKHIQEYLRQIVIARDKGCVLRDPLLQVKNQLPSCNGYTNDGELILQAEHLIERSNSATFADTRFVVCICKGHHGWKHFKTSNQECYEAVIRTIISPERVTLWDRCKATSWKPMKPNWKLELAALKQELAGYHIPPDPLLIVGCPHGDRKG